MAYGHPYSSHVGIPKKTEWGSLGIPEGLMTMAHLFSHYGEIFIPFSEGKQHFLGMDILR